MIRFIANGVPSNRAISGKNSLIDGGEKLPSSLAAVNRFSTGNSVVLPVQAIGQPIAKAVSWEV